jgi:hypothetical protein
VKPTAEQLEQWGASLREIDPGSLLPDEDGAKVRWYLGDNGTELFVWNHVDQPSHHVQLVFSRISVEWSTEQGLITGTFKSGSSTSGGRYDPYLLSVGPQVDEEVCDLALTLLKKSSVDAARINPLVTALEQAAAKKKQRPR